MSALPPKADIVEHVWYVGFVPKADIGRQDWHVRFVPEAEFAAIRSVELIVQRRRVRHVREVSIFAGIGADHWQTNTFSALNSALGSY